ncbi:exonuclease domain-containing protein [Rhizobium sp. SSA_523]|uniref:exonuclease domain-containing protein n=1 Tax=Rhizobium sp. SSA_523 TaxID=2952477 RepID=UPI002090CED1|nr:exonuclease domain-containing protein [Rhizobium sp. SSA_523]MCO5730145.1 exonuclease domain-containing protein [Rhizobium sp. SSA_523]WKC25209.1 exonuclease domain-containing protein [Rhizobium sp. SSA_523]
MKIRVIDMETTGQAEDKLKGHGVGIVEIGWSDVDDTGRVSRPMALLVNPGMTVPPEARAVHHISDEMLIGAPPPDRVLRMLMEGMEAGDFFCAHNAAFERAFFAGGPFPWICTMKCAKHLWEDAPGYSNQTLRYWLGLDQEFAWPELAFPPHRAGPDAYVTAHIANRMQLMKSPARLVELTNTPVLLKTVQSGKYAGELWSNMDEGYLSFILDPTKGPFKEEVLYTARYWLNKSRGLAGTSFA